MARKVGLTVEDIVLTGISIADRDGLAALSMAAVAQELGIRAPSLHHHVEGIDGLKRQIALRAAHALHEAVKQATKGLRGKAALLAVGSAYRRFAQKHPGQLASMLPAPRPGEDDELYAALAAPVMTIAKVLGELGVEGDNAIHAIRALRSYLHGFVDLERQGGFGMPQRLQTSFERGLELLVGGLL